MKRLRPMFPALALLLALPLGGCFWSVGGGSQKTVIERSAGEELADLKKALEAGALTPEEYEKLKQAYLNK